MSNFTRWLETNGQEPATFPRDAVAFLVRTIVCVGVAALSVFILDSLQKLILRNYAQTPNSPFYWLTVAPFLLFIPFAVIGAIAFIGGWQRLAARFRAPSKIEEGERWVMQSATIGGARYNHILTIRVTAAGLFLAIPFPFRFLHPPLLIPWPEIASLREGTFLFGRRTSLLVVGNPKIAAIFLANSRLSEAISQMREVAGKTL